jgi:hypothetical protein
VRGLLKSGLLKNFGASATASINALLVVAQVLYSLVDRAIEVLLQVLYGLWRESLPLSRFSCAQYPHRSVL